MDIIPIPHINAKLPIIPKTKNRLTPPILLPRIAPTLSAQINNKRQHTILHPPVLPNILNINIHMEYNRDRFSIKQCDILNNARIFHDMVIFLTLYARLFN